MSGEVVLGIDVGGTKVAGVAVDGQRVVAERSRPLENSPIEEQVLAVVTELRDAAGASVVAIGVAAPGQVDADAGVIRLAVNLDARDLPIGALVSEATGVPCFVEHDARAVAASLADGSAADLAYVSVGTGVSAGIVLGGRLLRGGAGLAGEIGHALADPAGPRCGCGLDGCLEAIASGPAIARAGRDGRPDEGAAPMTTADVYRLASGGDATAAAAVESAARHLAAAVRGLILGFGVTHVVIGGGVTHAGQAFEAPLRAAIARERAASALVARALATTTIEVLADDHLLGARGAAALARRRLLARDGDGVATRREVGTH